MDIEIYPPADISSSPFHLQWYELEITNIQFNLNHKIHEYKISNKNTFLMQGFEHSFSNMILSGVLTANSDVVGATLEEKKENLIEAASTWWTFNSDNTKVKSPKIKWRGWEQYMMIRRVDIINSAGEEAESYEYEMEISIHEGH